MKEIYFAKDQDSLTKRISKNIIHFTSDSLGKSFPRLTQKFAEQILCAPATTKGNKAPKNFNVHFLDVHIEIFRSFISFSSGRGAKNLFGKFLS